MAPAAPLWVVGANGLLGGAVAREARRRGLDVVTVRVPWDDPDGARAAFADAVDRLRGANDPCVAWCAGAGVTSSGVDVFEAERANLTAALAELETGLGRDGLRRLRLFLASSAGALYAGVEDPPYDERSPVVPLAAYGRAKLRLEADVTEFAQRTGARAVLGRISNLYGPGQNLAKQQGLVSVMLAHTLLHQPIQVYVPLDTIRDYVYVDDAATLVLGCLAKVATEPAGTATVKILASGRRTTIADLIGAVRTLIKRRPLIVQGASPLARAQARDLSMRSVVWPDLDRLPHRPLPDAMNQIWLDLHQHLST